MKLKNTKFDFEVSEILLPIVALLVAICVLTFDYNKAITERFKACVENKMQFTYSTGNCNVDGYNGK